MRLKLIRSYAGLGLILCWSSAGLAQEPAGCGSSLAKDCMQRGLAAPPVSWSPGKAPWIASLAVLGLSDALDIRSSYGLRELNPVLGRGQFGTRQAGLSAGITAGTVLWQIAMCQHVVCTKKDRIVLTVINLGISGVHFWLANRQFGVQRASTPITR